MSQCANKSTSLLLAGLLALSAVGIAQQGAQRGPQPQAQQASPQPSTSASPQAGPARQQQLTGQVLQQKEVELRSGGQRNSVVLLQTQDGQRLAVDLGPRELLSDVQLKSGTPISVSGTIITANNKPVFLARQFSVGGRDYQVSRAALPATRMSAQQPATGRASRGQHQFTGQIVDLKETGVIGSPERNQVALLQTQEGKRILVDLGPPSKLQGVQLKPGDQIGVVGHPARASNRTVLVATQLTTDNNQTISIEQNIDPARRRPAQSAGGGVQAPSPGTQR